MSAWSPATALAWQCFRLTRGRLLLILAVGTAFGWLLFDFVLPRALEAAPQANVDDARRGVARFATVILTLLALLWPGYTPLLPRSGTFPFAGDFTRPIRTSVLVGVPMLYLAVGTTVAYLVPALILGTAFDVELPGLPLAATLVAFHAAFTVSSWGSASKVVCGIAGFAIAGVLFAGGVFEILRRLAFAPLGAGSPAVPELEAPDAIRLAIVAVAAFALAVWGVERQRRGDRWAELLDGPGRAGKSLVAQAAALRRGGASELWRVPCPTSSPVRAELWFQMKCRGVPALAWGVMLAAAIPVLMGSITEFALLALFTVGALVAPLFAGVSASIWGRRGGWGAMHTAFEATRPLGTAELAAVQVVVIAGSVLAAWTLIAASAWASLGLLELEGPGFTLGGAAIERTIAATLGTLPGARVAGLAAIAVVELIGLVAILVALRTLTARYAKQLFLGTCALVAYALVLIFLLLANVDSAFVEGSFAERLIAVHVWIAAAGIPAGTAYLIARVLLERIASIAEAAVVVGVWVVIAIVYVALLHDSGVRLLELPTPLALLELAPLLLPLAAAALAPWSLARVRHG